MEYKITGYFQYGLSCYCNRSLILYSKQKKIRFTNNLISIYNADDLKIIEVVETGIFLSKFEVTYVNSDYFPNATLRTSFFSQTISLITNSNLFKFKAFPIPILTKKVGTLFLNDNKVGELKVNHFSFKKNFLLKLEEKYKNYEVQLLMLILISKTGYDPE